MANMALNIEQRLGQKLTNEQQLLWNYMLQRWPNLTFTPFVFMGAYGGTSFSVYNANILYLAYSLALTVNSTPGATVTQQSLNNELDVPFFRARNSVFYWDDTAAAYRAYANNVNIENIYFSRMSGAYGEIRFIGYILTI